MQKKTQPQNNQGHPPSAETTYPPVPQSGTWKTDYAWVSGMAGALSVLIIAAVYNRYNLLNTGFSLGGERISGHIDTKLFALVCVALVMLLVELIRLWLWDKRDFFRLHPLIKNKQYVDFAVECVVNFLLHLLLLFAVLVFYRSAGEYGYLKNAAFYQAWFRFIDIIWSAYLWGGLPYVLLTRAVKYDTQADQRDYSSLVKKVLVLLALKPLQIRTSPLGERDKKAIRGLLVKLFFAPLMTVFFVDQFGHLVNNMGYLVHLASSLGSGAAYTIRKFNNDVYNLSHAFIFSIDVALAWCGYVVSSRWVDNQTVSAEPTLLGWVVCIFCYPPFNNYLGLYYSAPSERMILQGQEQGLVAFFHRDDGFELFGLYVGHFVVRCAFLKFNQPGYYPKRALCYNPPPSLCIEELRVVVCDVSRYCFKFNLRGELEARVDAGGRFSFNDMVLLYAGHNRREALK